MTIYSLDILLSLFGASPSLLVGAFNPFMFKVVINMYVRQCIGERNGNPLQCSCLENPRDGKPGGLPSMGLTESDTTEAT